MGKIKSTQNISGRTHAPKHVYKHGTDSQFRKGGFLIYLMYT